MKPIPRDMQLFSNALETKNHWTYGQVNTAIHDALAGRNAQVLAMWHGWQLCWDNAPIHEE